MMASLRNRFLIVSGLAVALVAFVPACGGAAADKEKPAPAAQQEAAPAPKPAPAYDHALTDEARVLAGLDPEDTQRFAPVITRASWKAHKADFDTNWGQIAQQRFPLMRDWRDREFKPVVDACDTLFYPFGGPDFLNAYLFFPTCNQYLLFGLETVGSVPALEKMKDDRLDKALGETRLALADIFKRAYFITKSMEKELRTSQVDGTVPVILVMLARVDAQIVKIETDGPWNAKDGAAGRLPSATISFIAKGSDRVQKVTYIRVDMMNPNFSKQASLLAFLKGLGPVTTFVKSASYLMHDDRFSMVRDIVLGQSKALLQDDTGVPYKFFDKAKWTLTFYGKYSKPISDFNYGFQKDLDAAFKQPGAAKDLPFSFGYHWREGTSSVILAIRNAAAQ